VAFFFHAKTQKAQRPQKKPKARFNTHLLSGFAAFAAWRFFSRKDAKSAKAAKKTKSQVDPQFLK